MEEKMKIIGIQTKDCLYITDDINNSNTYNPTKLTWYKFDGEIPKPSYSKQWVSIDKIPTKVEKNIPKQRVNVRYELKDGFPVTENTPKVINKRYIEEEDEYYGVSSLYDYKYDETIESFEEVEFEIDIIDSVDGFKITKMDYTPTYSMFDKITTPEVLLPIKPCSLTVEQTYKIIREYVKRNIDPDWAKITSDYDFCFTVKKLITLDSPDSYQVDIANINNWSKRKRQPKYETRYRKTRELEIFQMAPKPYQSYTVIESFKGTSYDNMVENINKYLADLIEKINCPLKDCPTCKGLGVV